MPENRTLQETIELEYYDVVALERADLMREALMAQSQPVALETNGVRET